MTCAPLKGTTARIEFPVDSVRAPVSLARFPGPHRCSLIVCETRFSIFIESISLRGDTVSRLSLTYDESPPQGFAHVVDKDNRSVRRFFHSQLSCTTVKGRRTCRVLRVSDGK